tara:strand:- start:65 stop:433 length:369 start_codon:yes stop_codon:yes gene_type:complete
MKLKSIVEDFQQQKKRLSKEEKNAFLAEVSKYNELGSTIYRTEDLKRAAHTINELVNRAEEVTLQETDEWFDDLTVKRNMKAIKDGSKQFSKTVDEVSKLQQRLESLYEEIGHNLSRYYEIK